MACVMGSSPLARGGPATGHPPSVKSGLIPARAGRTRPPRRRSRPRRAHPRSRGADLTAAAGEVLRQGSSPLARGGRPARPRCVTPRGLIPARAGRTGAHSAHSRPGRAHPRSRGADAASPARNSRDTGSSPLARGGLWGEASRRRSPRLIPARAGRTVKRHCGVLSVGAHPRSRGADSRRRQEQCQFRGSSPLARGGHVGLQFRGGRDGLIPARAGRTGYRSAAPRTARAHPRSRGADPDRRVNRVLAGGSSPLARGGPRLRVSKRICRGLIPARAGRTAVTVTGSAGGPAHPRSRGADISIRLSREASYGSSPLARGGPG